MHPLLKIILIFEIILLVIFGVGYIVYENKVLEDVPEPICVGGSYSLPNFTDVLIIENQSSKKEDLNS